MRFLAATALACAVALPAQGAVYLERGDAGESPAGARATAGPGVALEAILGQIESTEFVDLYRIRITAPSQFSASTLNDESLGLDTQLFLFDAGGVGIAANDDFSDTDARSLLPQGHPLYASRAPGDYLLGISTFNSDPIDSSGETVFPDVLTGVVPPARPGSSLAEWIHDPFSEFGPYRIDLTGAGFAVLPEPASVHLAALAALLAFVVRRKRPQQGDRLSRTA